MSITTHHGPAPSATARTRLVTLPLALTFLTEFSTLTSFFLLLSVMPMLAAAAGTGSSGAGLMTGSLLLGTVIAEAAAATAIRRLGHRMTLAAGAVLLGAPALVLLRREPEIVMAGVGFVRGLGFGLCGVTAGALTATLLPPDRRGEGLGLLGLVSGVPAIVALPAGILLAGHRLVPAAAAMAAVTGLLPLITLRSVPGRGAAPAGQPATRIRGARGAGLRGAGLQLPLIFGACTVAAGVIDSFLPLAKDVPSSLCSMALLIQAIVATICRWQAGRMGDRSGHSRLLIPALIVAAAGVTAMAGLPSRPLIVASSSSEPVSASWKTRHSHCCSSTCLRPQRARSGTLLTTPGTGQARQSSACSPPASATPRPSR